METVVAKNVIDLIQAERERRIARLPDHPDAAYDQWLFRDEPFLNELCLVLLVAIRHELERDLIWIAARTGDGRELDSEEYGQRVRDWRDRVRRGTGGWKKLEAALQLESIEEWGTSMKTLQLLANSYKHDPWSMPDEMLQRHLATLLKDRWPGLGQVANFAPLRESDALRQRLAASLNLSDNVGYCEIASDFLIRVKRFLAKVQSRCTLSPVKPRLVSLVDFLE